MSEQLIHNIGKELLEGTEIGNKIKKAMDIVADIQMGLCIAADKENENLLVQIKVGTVLALGLFRKYLSGKKPEELGKEDWAELLKDAAQLSICTDDCHYSIFVFRLYAGYIETSVSIMEDRLSVKSADAIRQLGKELIEKSDLLEKGSVNEVRYIEDCLWISLEAMLKLLAGFMSSHFGENQEKVSMAVTSVAFELARYSLLKKEQRQLDFYLSNQRNLDEELQSERKVFEEEIERETEKYKILISNAFTPGFRNALQDSISLASATGVPENEILRSEGDIDNFFL